MEIYSYMVRDRASESINPPSHCVGWHTLLRQLSPTKQSVFALQVMSSCAHASDPGPCSVSSPPSMTLVVGSTGSFVVHPASRAKAAMIRDF